MAYCSRCDRYFGSEHALDQHKDNSNSHHLCYDCNKDFASWHALVQHWVQSPRHDYCQRCDEHFDDEDELQAHNEDEHFYCQPCRKFLENARGLQEHDRQVHNYCTSCKRSFQSPANLDAHLRSSIHQPLKYHCPGRGCTRSFVSASALTQHFESGTCPSRVTRADIDFYVAQVDRTGIITDPARLICGPNGQPTGMTITRYWASDRSWNGSGFECYICHREFTTLAGLNQHLNSGAHTDNIYRCPRGFGGCNTQFSRLSALCQHVESGSCDVKRFKKDIDRLIDNGLSRGMRALTA